MSDQCFNMYCPHAGKTLIDQQELTSIRNQLAEAQRKLKEETDLHLSMWKERDQLKQQLADANALLERWSTEQSAFLKSREDAYEQEKKAFEAKLIACEASRERLKIIARPYFASGVSFGEWIKIREVVFDESPQTALTEALKPVRDAIVEWKAFYKTELELAEKQSRDFANQNDDLGSNWHSGKKSGLINADIALTALKQALSELLDKLCPGSAPESDNPRSASPTSPHTPPD